MENIVAVILAAGEGKRMKSKTSKVLQLVQGKQMLGYVLEATEELGVDKTIIVIGHKADEVKEYIGDRGICALQSEQLGTGHAVMMAAKELENVQDDASVLVLCGDTPAITAETLGRLIEKHKKECNSLTLLTSIVPNPTGYGRIVKDENDQVLKIVEEKDASVEERTICEVNAGMYCFKAGALRESLSKITNDNAQQEYYLTDTVEILLAQGERISTFIVEDADELMGVNDRLQIAEAERYMRLRNCERLMREGVTIVDPPSTYVAKGVKVGCDTIIYPNTILEEGTEIGEDCIIGPNSRISNSKVGNATTINNSVLLDSTVGNMTKIGPFAYLRPGSNVADKVKIGDFVEIKNSNIGDKSAISHLTYVGDADVGRNVNLGCGVVFVNYDGKNKFRTKVGDHAFIGCNTNLVSPVEVGEHAFTAAGSTITEDVPSMALGIGRARQVNKEEWVSKNNRIRKEKP